MGIGQHRCWRAREKICARMRAVASAGSALCAKAAPINQTDVANAGVCILARLLTDSRRQLQHRVLQNVVVL